MIIITIYLLSIALFFLCVFILLAFVILDSCLEIIEISEKLYGIILVIMGLSFAVGLVITIIFVKEMFIEIINKIGA